VVSTDDADIARIASEHGAEVPFTRPSELANEVAGTAPVVRHALEELAVSDGDTVVCLYPTAALPGSLLAEGLGLAITNQGRFVVSVGRHRSPLERALRETAEGTAELVTPEHLLTRTQDLPVHFFDAGKFYIASAGLWRGQETMMSKPFTPFLLPDWASVDIDEPDDWPVAQALHKAFVVDATS
jgi:pseudaminic acid cytidylyltransferase